MKKLIALCALAALAAGCSTHVRSAAFRWQYAYPTTTKTEFDTRYGRITTYARWPDGSESEKVSVSLSSFEDPPEIVLRPSVPPPAAPPRR